MSSNSHAFCTSGTSPAEQALVPKADGDTWPWKLAQSHFPVSNDFHDAELSAAFARVDQNPTDLQYRFLLGECLFRRARHKEAIHELWKAKMNPNTRAAAMKLLAESFSILGDQQQAEDLLRQLDSERYDEDEDSGSAPSPSPLRPVDPTISSAMNIFPEDETK